MDICVLGPLHVTIAGRDVPIPALQPNRDVSTDRLIAGLWGEDAPSGLGRTLQTHVFQLRRRLQAAQAEDGPGNVDEPVGEILTRGSAYRLVVDESAIDAGRF